MTKNLSFGPDFGSFWPKLRPKKPFSRDLPPLDVIHCCKLSLYAISRKKNKINLRKWQKSSLRLDLGSFGPNLGPKFFCVYFTSTRCQVLFQALIVCNFKEN